MPFSEPCPEYDISYVGNDYIGLDRYVFVNVYNFILKFFCQNKPVMFSIMSCMFGRGSERHKCVLEGTGYVVE